MLLDLSLNMYERFAAVLGSKVEAEETADFGLFGEFVEEAVATKSFWLQT